jgi:leader peptidase (prepilin peptidase)/N-methyltransferase
MLEILAANTPLFLTGVFVFGLLIGSFLNVVILRLPARMEHDWQCQCKELLEIESTSDEEASRPPGIMWSRSQCPKCGHLIRSHENIPLLSYLLLRGRCASCKAGISIRYPLVEAITALLFLLVAMHFGPNLQTIAALGITGLLIALAGIDIDHQLLPDNLTLFLLWAGLFASLFNVFVDPVSSIIGALAGYLSLGCLDGLANVATDHPAFLPGRRCHRVADDCFKAA